MVRMESRYGTMMDESIVFKDDCDCPDDCHCNCSACKKCLKKRQEVAVTVRLRPFCCHAKDKMTKMGVG